MSWLKKWIKPIGVCLRAASLSRYDLWRRGELLLSSRDYTLVDETQLKIRLHTDPTLHNLEQMTIGLSEGFLLDFVADLEDPRFMTYAQWKRNCPHVHIEYYLHTPGGEEFMIYGICGGGVKHDPDPTRRF